MSIDDFIKQFVEGYLFHDLEGMSKIVLPSGQNDGAAGYPMVATALAGMELLGNLLMSNSDPFNPKSGNDYFLNFWDNYFCKQNSAYTGLGRLFRQLMRNGIAHTFVAKPGIFVVKGSGMQILIDTVKKEIYVDCNVFYNDFEQSYVKFVKPILDGSDPFPATTKATMQGRLDDVNRVYSTDSNRLFTNLPPLDPSLVDIGNSPLSPLNPYFSTGTPVSNASGIRQPTTPLVSATRETITFLSSPPVTGDLGDK